MKRPASQYYWGDWRKDLALQSCSLAARGLWHEMNCLMHEGVPYGHLSINGNRVTTAQLARLVGITVTECSALLAELEAAAIYSITEEGLIYSRRMVRDEAVRKARMEGGSAGAEHGSKGGFHGAKGGRPKKDKGGLETPLQEFEGGLITPLKPPPSSSSSSSSLRSEDLPPPSGPPLAGNAQAPPTPEPRASRSATTAQGTRLPADWEPDDAGWRMAVELLGSANRAFTVRDIFRDHWAAQPGAKGRKTDWPATWRNWIREEVRRENRSTGRSGGTERPRKLSLVEQAAVERAAFAKRVGLLGEDDEPVRPCLDESPRHGSGSGRSTVVEGDFRYVGAAD